MKTKVVIELEYILDDSEIRMDNLETGEHKTLEQLGGREAYLDTESNPDMFEDWSLDEIGLIGSEEFTNHSGFHCLGVRFLREDDPNIIVLPEMPQEKRTLS